MQIKVNIKAPRHWPLCGEFTGTGEFPAQRASNAENVSIWWRHHEIPGSPFSMRIVFDELCHHDVKLIKYVDIYLTHRGLVTPNGDTDLGPDDLGKGFLPDGTAPSHCLSRSEVYYSSTRSLSINSRVILTWIGLLKIKVPSFVWNLHI